MNTRRYLLISAATFVFVGVLMYTGTGFAQVNGAPFCSANMSTVSQSQSVMFTASGGNGSYAWITNDGSGITGSGTQFSLTFPTSGVHSVQVTSNGQTSICSVMVLSTGSSNFVSNNFSSGTLVCLPSSQNVAVGQTANLTATGGNNSYSWIIPEISLSNPTGTGSYVTYTTPGTRIVTVMSGGASATCAINVVGSAVPPVVTIPGLPNTGGGYGHW